MLERFVNCALLDANNNEETTTTEFRKRRISSIKDIPQFRSNSLVESILNPANREFLENQGKNRDIHSNKKTKKLVLGTRTYHFDVDGDTYYVPQKSPIPSPKHASESSVNTLLEDAVKSLNGDKDLLCASSRERRKGVCRQRNFSGSSCCDTLHEKSPSSSSTHTLTPTVITITNSDGVETNEDEIHKTLTCDNERRRRSTRDEVAECVNQSCQTEETQFTDLASLNTHLTHVAIRSLQLALEIYKNHSLKLVRETWCKCDGKSKTELGQELHVVDELRNRIECELEQLETRLDNHLDADDSSRDELLHQVLSLTQLLKKASNNLIKLRLRANSMPDVSH